MRWYEARLLKRETVGLDVLKKPVTELRDTGRAILVRTAPMAPSRVTEEGNAGETMERTLITRADASLLEGAEAIELRGERWEIASISSWEHPVALRVRRCGKWAG